MSNPAVSRWKNLPAKELASAIYDVVKDNYKLLENGTAKPRKSIWGDIVYHKFNVNTPTDRLWAYVAYNTNANNVRDMYRELCSDCERPNIPGQGKWSESKTVYCFCRKPFTEGSDASMVECESCSEWYHMDCVGVNRKEIKDTEFVCDFCNGITDRIPLIFQTSGLGNVSFFYARRSQHQQFQMPDEESLTGKTVPTPPPSQQSSSARCSEAESDVKRSNSEQKPKRKKEPTPASSTSSFQEAENVPRSNGVQFSHPTPPKPSANSTAGSSSEDTQTKNQRNSGAHRSQANAASDQTGEFTCTIPLEDWIRIQPVKKTICKSRRFAWRLKPNDWTYVFHAAFSKQNGSCVLKFHDHRVNDPAKHHLLFFSSTAVCKRPLCTMEYTFRMQKPPSLRRDCVVHVSGTGELKHDPTKIAMRRLGGKQRAEARSALKNMRPAKLLTKKFAAKELNLEAVASGNYTAVQSLKKYQNIRSEALKLDKLHEDPILDIVLTKNLTDQESRFRGKQISGYVHGLSVFPFTMVMFTERQLVLLRDLQKYDKELVLHLDSTGSITTALSAPYGTKQQYYYALVAVIIGCKTPGVPLLEFISNDQHVPAISGSLTTFLHAYRKMFSTKKPHFGVRRVETDFSFALISSVLTAVEVGPLWKYLREVWGHLSGDIPGDIPFVLHICRVHVMKYLQKSIDTHYGNASNAVQNTLQQWMHGFIHGKDLWSFCRRTRDIIILSARKNYITEVKEVEKHVSSRTNRRGLRPWSIVNLDNVPVTPPLKIQSPFGYYAYEFCRLSNISTNFHSDSPSDNEDTSDDSEDPNPYYNRPFLEYVLGHILPYAALQDHSMLTHNRMSLARDTNNPVEGWFKIIKIDEHKDELPTSDARFLRIHIPVMHGRLVRFETSLRRMKGCNEESTNSPAEDGSSTKSRKKKHRHHDSDDHDTNPRFHTSGLGATQDSTPDNKPSEKNYASEKTNRENKPTGNTTKPKEPHRGHASGNCKPTNRNSREQNPEVHESDSDAKTEKQHSKSSHYTKAESAEAEMKPQSSKPANRKTKSKHEKRSGYTDSEEGEVKATSKTKTHEETGKRKRASNHPEDVLPEMEEEVWESKKRKMNIKRPKTTKTPLHGLHGIPWDGKLRHAGATINMSNTCSFDNVLFIIYAMYKTEQVFTNFINNLQLCGDRAAKTLNKIFRHLDYADFDKAKTLCVLDLIKDFPPARNPRTGEILLHPLISGNFHGSEETILNAIAHFVTVVQTRNCPNPQCQLPKTGEDIFPIRDMGWDVRNPTSLAFALNQGISGRCVGTSKGEQQCTSKNVKTFYKFKDDVPPPFFACAMPARNDPGMERTIPKAQTILGQKYLTFAYTLNTGDHYITIFVREDGTMYKFNGLYPENLPRYTTENKYSVSTIFLIRADTV